MVVGLAVALAGCNASLDRRLLAPTDDEYVGPLDNAIVGTPDGVQVIPPSAGVASAAAIQGATAQQDVSGLICPPDGGAVAMP
jgi:hypothetical protein